MTPTESARRSAAALDKIRGTNTLALDVALGELTAAQHRHTAVVGAAQTALNYLRRRVDEVTAQHDLAARQERERMAQRLGRSFQRDPEASQ